MLAATVALEAVLDGSRPRARHRDGTLRTRRRPPARRRRRTVLGQRGRGPDRSPTTTSGTSGAGPALPAMRAGRCSRSCRPACGRASGSGGAVSCTRRWPACAPALEQDRMWGGTGSVSRSRAGFQIGCHLDRGDVAAARRSADAFAGGPLVGEGGRVYQQALAQPARRGGPLRGGPRGSSRRHPRGSYRQSGLEPVAGHQGGRVARPRAHGRGDRGGGGGSGSAPPLGCTELPRQGLYLLGAAARQ